MGMSKSSPLQVLKATKEALERSLHHVQQHGAVSSIEEMRHGISTTQMLIDLLESTENGISDKQAWAIAKNHEEALDPNVFDGLDRFDTYAHGMADGIRYAYTHLIVSARAQQVIAAGRALRDAMKTARACQFVELESELMANRRGEGNQWRTQAKTTLMHATDQAIAEWDRLDVKLTEHVVTVDQAMKAVERIGIKETTEQGNSRHETGYVSLDPKDLRTELTNVNGKA